MTQIITALSEIEARYRMLYCDLWGCLHNGVRVFDAAAEALSAFRARGGTVVLLTNAPRTRGSVATQLEGLEVPPGCYDIITTSGDAAQGAMAAGRYGRKVLHIGPERDLSFFRDEDGAPIDVERVDLEEAEGIVLTGLYDDETEVPEDYRLQLMRAKSRGLRMLCANPDVIVDRGDRRIYCAGAIAAFYQELGGEVDYFGKPHPPIYQLARSRGEAARGAVVADEEILCIGDGIATDIKGGLGENLDALFITGGLAAEETGTVTQPEAERLEAFVAKHQMAPRYAMGFLR